MEGEGGERERKREPAIPIALASILFFTLPAKAPSHPVLYELDLRRKGRRGREGEKKGKRKAGGRSRHCSSLNLKCRSSLHALLRGKGKGKKRGGEGKRCLPDL